MYFSSRTRERTFWPLGRCIVSKKAILFSLTTFTVFSKISMSSKYIATSQTWQNKNNSSSLANTRAIEDLLVLYNAFFVLNKRARLGIVSGHIIPKNRSPYNL